MDDLNHIADNNVALTHMQCHMVARFFSSKNYFFPVVHALMSIPLMDREFIALELLFLLPTGFDCTPKLIIFCGDIMPMPIPPTIPGFIIPMLFIAPMFCCCMAIRCCCIIIICCCCIMVVLFIPPYPGCCWCIIWLLGIPPNATCCGIVPPKVI